LIERGSLALPIFGSLLQLKMSAWLTVGDVQPRERSAFALYPCDRHPAAHQSVFFPVQLVSQARGEQDGRIEVGIRRDFLSLLDRLIVERENDLRAILPGATRSANQLALASRGDDRHFQSLSIEEAGAAAGVLGGPERRSR